MNVFKNIVEWNEERGLIEKGFDHKKEASFIVEELLESTGEYNSFNVRERASAIAEDIIADTTPTDEEILDSWADIIVFAIGAIKKKGYDPEKVMHEVCEEISSRTGELVDGKFVRDPKAVLYQADFSKCKIK